MVRVPVECCRAARLTCNSLDSPKLYRFYLFGGWAAQRLNRQAWRDARDCRFLYSVRKAVVGSMDAARRAGAKQAKITVAARIAGTAAKVAKSNVET